MPSAIAQLLAKNASGSEVADGLRVLEGDEVTGEDVATLVQKVCSGMACEGSGAGDWIKAAKNLSGAALKTSPEQREALLRSLLQAPVQEADQEARHAAYSLLLTALKEEGGRVPRNPSFVTGFIRMIDGERDPRCLLHSFSLHEAVVSMLEADGCLPELSRHDPSIIEELFDVVGCYFPIAYTPPRTEKDPVRKADLKSALLRCLQRPAFSDFTLPFATDKLSSTLGEHKTDALQLLRSCADAYGTDAAPLLFEPYLADIWSILRTETLQATIRSDDAVLASLFETVVAISRIACLFQRREDTLAHLRPLFDGILNMVSVPEGHLNAQAYTALTHFAAKAHVKALQLILENLLPVVSTALDEKPEDVNRRKAVLGVYSAVLGAAARTEGAAEALGTEQAGATLRKMCAAVFDAAGSASAPEDLLVTAAEACSSVVRLHAGGLVDEDCGRRAAEGLAGIVRRADNSMVRNAVAAAAAAAKGCWGLLTEALLPGLPSDAMLKAASECPATFAAAVTVAARTGARDTLHLLAASVTDGDASGNGGFFTADTPPVVSAPGFFPLDPRHNFTVPSVQLCYSMLPAATRPAAAGAACEVVVPPEGVAAALPASGADAVVVAARICMFGSPMPEGWSASPHAGILARGAMRRGGQTAAAALEALPHLPAEALKQCMEEEIREDLPFLAKAFGHKAAPLWKQRVYHAVFPTLLRKGDFAAVSAVATNVPPQLLQQEEGGGSKLIAAAVAALQTPSSLLPALSLLARIARTGPAAFASVPVLQALVPALLSASCRSPLRAERKQALEILYVLASSPDVSHVAAPFKSDVIHALKPTLDDGKRCVRRAATEAISAWYLLS